MTQHHAGSAAQQLEYPLLLPTASHWSKPCTSCVPTPEGLDSRHQGALHATDAILWPQPPVMHLLTLSCCMLSVGVNEGFEHNPSEKRRSNIIGRRRRRAAAGALVTP
jgi:hypothetical protein